MTPSVDPAITHGPLGPGTRLGRYQILRRLATGGMAELYLARHVGAAGYQKVVALKRVRPHLAEDQQFVARFLNEARLAAGLDHSSIAHVIDFGVEGGEHFMAMEYVHGRSVMQLLQQFERCPLPLACAVLIVRDVAAALHHAHERRGPDGRPLGLVHRDVSPSNVLVSFDGDVKLVDFGIAKATAEGSATRTGTILGKLSYMAPEQLRGQRIDRRSDVFALGIVLFELLTGKPLFARDNDLLVMQAVCMDPLPSLSALRPDVPPELERIAHKALARDRAERYESAAALRRDLLAFARTLDTNELPDEELSRLMRRIFSDRIADKSEMLQRVRAGQAPLRLVGGDSTGSSGVAAAGLTPEVSTGTASPQVQVIPVAEAPAKKRGSAWLIGAAVVAVGAALTAGLVLTRRPEAAAGAAAGATNEATASAASAHPQVPSVEVAPLPSSSAASQVSAPSSATPSASALASASTSSTAPARGPRPKLPTPTPTTKPDFGRFD